MKMWRWRSERGAVLIHTGVALIGLLAFSALSIDYGVLWVSRGQAQNAADAAALAAATSMAYGDPTSAGFENRIRAVAVATGQANLVWGAAPIIDPDTDVTIGDCPAGSPGIEDQCVRVDVYRNQARGNALPTFFARLVGVTQQGVQATATAQVATGSTVQCVKPWIIPDKWIERRPTPGPWTLESKFDRYAKVKGKMELAGPLDTLDEYVPASGANPGSGFTVPDDVGMLVRLKTENWKDDDISPGNFRAIVLGAGPGAAEYEACISGCCGSASLNQVVDTEPGGMVGPTRSGVEALIASDPGAVWMCNGDPPFQAGAGQNCSGFVSTGLSSRLVPISTFNVQDFQEQVAAGEAKSGGRHDLQITRIIGFFIERMDGKDVIGRFAYYPSASGIGGGVNNSGNFLRTIVLIR